MITIAGLHKRFGRLEVLRGLDVAVRRGRVTALVGPNGAGKTTLLKIILGLVVPDSGRVVVDGHVLDGTPDYRRGIGYMPQLAGVPGDLRGRGLLRMLGALRAGPPPDLALARAFGMGDALDRPIAQLSGGTRQKVKAVLALAFPAGLLILDEPTAGLDPVACRILKDRLLAAREQGTTILITSHALAELEELADDVLFLDEGRVAWHGPVDALRDVTAATTLERAVVALLVRAARAEPT